MAAYKRSDPTKLAKDREEIARQMAPQGPGLFERIVGGITERISQRKRRRVGFGPAPRVEGTMQHGFKKEDNTA